MITLRLKKYAITLSVSVIILVLCLINTESLPEASITNLDKIFHLFMFLGLSGAFFFDSTSWLRKQISYLQVFGGTFLFPVLFGGAIELIQEYFSPFRTGDWLDFLFNTIGAIIGLFVCLNVNNRLSS